MGKLLSTTSSDDGRFIQSAIDNGIRLKARELVEKHKKQLELDMNNAVQEVVARVSLRIASEMSFQDNGKTIRFEISKKDIFEDTPHE